MTVKETRVAWYLKCFLAFALTVAAYALQFPQYFFNLNNEAFVKNGDWYITMYDMIYFVRYDEGSTLSAMNYPDGEFVFMTDANGSFAMLMRWIDQHLWDIDQIIPALFFGFVYFGLGLCGMFLFIILRTWGISNVVAFTLAPLITLLSPQMARIPAHLSLTFPFLIPMTLLWCLRKYRKPQWEWWDAIFALVTFFFFMNNAYVGFIMCMLAAGIGFFILLQNRKDKQLHRSAAKMIGIPVLITIAVFVLMKINDPFDDRIKEQWGFFSYNSQIASLYAPRYSLVASFVEKYKTNDKRSIEKATNLGVVPILLGFSFLIYLIRKKFRPGQPPLIAKDKFLSASLWAVFCMFLFACNTSLFPIQDFVESYMDHLLMFKASGRFSWPLYFVYAIVAAKILQEWMNRLQRKGKYAPWLLFVPLMAFYAYECNFYLNRFFEHRSRINYLTRPETSIFEKGFSTHGIHKENYQAIFVLPLMIGWNEQVLADVFIDSERGALITSSLTGIPMLNSRLSRNSTGATLRATQISSHPYLKKELLHKLPNQKNILLVKGKGAEDKLSVGEKHLESLATLVYEADRFLLYSLPLEKVFRYEEMAKARALISAAKDSLELQTPPLLHLPFDEEKDATALFGTGSHSLQKGEDVFLDTLLFFEEAQSLDFFIWNEVQYEKYGMPDYWLYVTDENKKMEKNYLQGRKTKDVYKNWLLANTTIKVPKGKVSLKIVATANQKLRIDEMLLLKQGEQFIHPVPGTNTFLLNNLPIFME